MPALFVAVDVGTTGARAVAFDRAGRVVREVRRAYATSVPHVGWAEQDASAWHREARLALAGLCAAVDAADVEAIGVTGQTPTVVPVGVDLEPLRPGMLYRDNRADDEAAEIASSFGAEALHRRTGHQPAAFHIAPKLLWLRHHEPDVLARTRWFLQPRDVVVHRLTGRVATDETHANSTLLFDLRARRWASDLIGALGFDACAFPEVVPAWTVVGGLTIEMARATGLRFGLPVVIGGGDSQCAAYGAGVIVPGPISEMAGSSSCINSAVMEPVDDLRVTHYSHVVPDVFTTEVGLNTTGAAIRWAVDTLGFGTYDAFAAAVAAGRRRVAGAAGSRGIDAFEVVRDAAPWFRPHLGDGERDDPRARGVLDGIRESHDASAVAYAVVEGVAAAVARRVELLARSGTPVTELRAAGGGTRLAALGQAKADRLQLPVVHFDVDTAALGAAMLAAAATGHQAVAQTALDAAHARAQRFTPDPDFVAVAAWRRSAEEDR